MKLKKLVVAAACAAAAVIATVSLAACSGGGATLTGEYLSNNTYEYQNFATGMPPEMTYNYYYATYKAQTLETYSDGTYCLTMNEIMFSNVNFGQGVPTNEATANDRGQKVIKYYGTFTQESDPTDETLTFITINVPERVVFASSGYPTLDTANWTEEMTESAVNLAAQPQGGLGVSVNEDGTVTADMVLEGKTEGFDAEGIEIMVTLNDGKFTQVSW
ncbi:MAG TPA: hypothetical protein IAC90_00785 [Candidatus Coproplasma stercorigallinarum]|nr:hypothetical protein [Candidatus Coproplasma stercorigallinarum]